MIFINCLIALMAGLSSASNPAAEVIPTEQPLLVITQNGVSKKIIPGTNTIQLSRAPFEIQFQLNNYTSGRNTTFQFAAFKNRESLDFTADGIQTFKIPYFTSGSGLARPRRGPYPYLILNKEGHHYLFYESESSNTAEMVTELDEGGYELKWAIDSVYENKIASSMRNIQHDEIFCVAFFDKNKNKTVDDGEFAKIEIDFR